MDLVSPTQRSFTMSRVKSFGGKTTEKRLRAYLVRAGVKGWKLNNNEILGKPDFVFQSKKIAIFVDGCFWHMCPRCCRLPKSNAIYWRQKITKNKLRDRRYSRILRKNRWKVIRIWEHEIKEKRENSIQIILEAA